MKAPRDTWVNPGVALALCLAGGALLAWLRTPLPWMIGPLLAMAVCNFAGARLRAVPASRQLGQLIIGTALGLYFTPLVAREVASYWPLLICAALFAILVASACGGLLTLAGIANSFMFGPLLAAIALTSNEVQFSSIPTWTTNLGQLLLGCALGSRFEKHFLGSLGRYAGAVLASILISIALAAAASVALAQFTGLPAASLMLAIAPGGIAEMCITAKVLQLGVPLVTAAHVTRVLVLINATAPIYRFGRYLRGPAVR